MTASAMPFPTVIHGTLVGSTALERQPTVHHTSTQQTARDLDRPTHTTYIHTSSIPTLPCLLQMGSAVAPNPVP